MNVDKIITYGDYVIDISLICQCNISEGKFNYTMKTNYGFTDYYIKCSREDGLILMKKIHDYLTQ